MCGGDFLAPKRATEKPVNMTQEVEVVNPTVSVMHYVAPVLMVAVICGAAIAALALITR